MGFDGSDDAIQSIMQGELKATSLQHKTEHDAVVLDLRAPHEPRGYDEPREVTTRGMSYVNIPVGTAPLSDQLMAEILDVLRGHAGKTIFFHCASANRVGGALLPHLILDHDMEEDDALVIARRVGLRAPELEQWGLDYSRRHRQGSGA